MASTTSSVSSVARTNLAIPSTSCRAPVELSVLNVNCANVWCQLVAEFVERKRRAIGCCDQFDITAERMRQIAPALAELAGSEHQNSVTRRCKIRNCSFHNAGTRRCQYQYIILRADEILHIGEHPLKQRAEIGGAMVHGE